MPEINLLTVLAATVASFVYGAVWYSPALFLDRWCKETGVDPKATIANPAKVYGSTFLLTLVAAAVLACFIGPQPELGVSVLSGFFAGTGLVAASLGINYQFANCSLMHWMIDSGFHVGRFVIMGLILGLWP